MIDKKHLYVFLLGLISQFLFLPANFAFAGEVGIIESPGPKYERDEESIHSNSSDAVEKGFQGEEVLEEKIIDSFEYCINSYQEDQECPKDICALQCTKQLDARVCILECLPRQCVDIVPEKCPEDICKVLSGCNNKKVCYPKETQESPQCGSLAYAGDDAECCEGFVKRCGIEFFDGSCDMEGTGSLDSVPICIPCGNGICNQFENRCNCPEDCKNDDNVIELLKAIKARLDTQKSEK